MAYGKRQNPVKKADERMTRADSLSSISKYGRVLPKSAQAEQASSKPGPLSRLRNALKKRGK